MHDSNVSTPLSSSTALQLNDGSALTDAKQYRKVLSKLQYLSFTCSDPCFAVNKLSQFMHAPTITHWQAIKRLLRYLKQTMHYGLLLSRTPFTLLHVYTDADWARDPNDHISTSGYITFLGHTPLSWSSKKQCTVARSSTMAEYQAMAGAVAKTNWLTNLLGELHIRLSHVPNIYCDNIGTIYLCQNLVFHSRMKHIAVDFHFVRD